MTLKYSFTVRKRALRRYGCRGLISYATPFTCPQPGFLRFSVNGPASGKNCRLSGSRILERPPVPRTVSRISRGRLGTLCDFLACARDRLLCAGISPKTCQGSSSTAHSDRGVCVDEHGYDHDSASRTGLQCSRTLNHSRLVKFVDGIDERAAPWRVPWSRILCKHCEVCHNDRTQTLEQNRRKFNHSLDHTNNHYKIPVVQVKTS